MGATLFLLMILWPGTVDWQPYSEPVSYDTCLVYKAQAARYLNHVMVWEQPQLKCAALGGTDE
jgi:hypothetical protein